MLVYYKAVIIVCMYKLFFMTDNVGKYLKYLKLLLLLISSAGLRRNALFKILLGFFCVQACVL